MTPTRIVQLCQTQKPTRCGRVATAFSTVKSRYVCGRCADPNAVSGGIGSKADRPEVLRLVTARTGGGWQ